MEGEGEVIQKEEDFKVRVYEATVVPRKIAEMDLYLGEDVMEVPNSYDLGADSVEYDFRGEDDPEIEELSFD